MSAKHHDGKPKTILQRKGFYSGFRSWMETHHEVVAWITLTFGTKGTVAHETHEAVGTTGLYELAEEWTNEFEKEHRGWDWEEIDYWDTIEIWLENKNKTV